MNVKMFAAVASYLSMCYAASAVQKLPGESVGRLEELGRRLEKSVDWKDKSWPRSLLPEIQWASGLLQRDSENRVTRVPDELVSHLFCLLNRVHLLPDNYVEDILAPCVENLCELYESERISALSAAKLFSVAVRLNCMLRGEGAIPIDGNFFELVTSLDFYENPLHGDMDGADARKIILSVLADHDQENAKRLLERAFVAASGEDGGTAAVKRIIKSLTF